MQVLGLGIFVGDVIMEAGLRAFLIEVTWFWAPNQGTIFGSSFSWKLGSNPSL